MNALDGLGLGLGPLRNKSWSPSIGFILQSVLADFGYECEKGEYDDYRFSIHTTERSYRSQMFVDEDSGLIRYNVLLDVPFLEFDEPRVIEIIGRLSSELVWGSFDYNFDLSFPRFRNAARIDAT